MNRWSQLAAEGGQLTGGDNNDVQSASYYLILHIVDGASVNYMSGSKARMKNSEGAELYERTADIGATRTVLRSTYMHTVCARCP